MKLSFIIPALNEQESIGDTIQSIKKFCPPGCSAEIVVADHGSFDQTVATATQEGAKVIQPRTATIAGLRNAGARVATGDLLVFLDADVQLTEAWQRHASILLPRLTRDGNTVSGSRVLPPQSDSSIINCWFRPLALQANQTTYINSAHLIVPRKVFQSIRGFCDELATGEDYDFCRRAAAAGFSIQPDLKLVAYHDRYPITVPEFLRREIWHGQGDAKSLQAVASSKVALASILFVLLHAVMALGIVAGQLPVAYTAGLGVLLTLLFITWKKFGIHQRLGTLCVRLGLAYVYLLARALSLVCHTKGWNRPAVARAS